MVFNEVFQRFLQAAPACVIHRALMENIFAPEKLDAVFHGAAEVQYERELLFSTLVEMTSHVVCRIAKTTRMAYLAQCENITVTLTAVYKKLAGIELGTSQAAGAFHGPPGERIDLAAARVASAVAAGLSGTDSRRQPSRQNRPPLEGLAQHGGRRPAGTIVGSARPATDGDRRGCVVRGRPCPGAELVESGRAASGAKRFADRRPQLRHAGVLVRNQASQSPLYHSRTWANGLEIAGKTPLYGPLRNRPAARGTDRAVRSGDRPHHAGAANYDPLGLRDAAASGKFTCTPICPPT